MILSVNAIYSFMAAILFCNKKWMQKIIMFWVWRNYRKNNVNSPDSSAVKRQINTSGFVYNERKSSSLFSRFLDSVSVALGWCCNLWGEKKGRPERSLQLLRTNKHVNYLISFPALTELSR